MALSISLKLLMSAGRGDSRTANTAHKLESKISKLTELEKEVKERRSNETPDRYQQRVGNLLNQHREIAHEINLLVLDIIDNEYAGFIKDVELPEAVLKSFVDVLKKHQEAISNPSLRPIINALIKDFEEGHYSKLVDKVDEIVSETIDVFAREKTGAPSAYALSHGDVGVTDKLIEQRELKKRDLDQLIKKIKQKLDDAIKEINQHLQKNSEKEFKQLMTKIKTGKGYAVGDKEFMRTPEGKWYYRQIGSNSPRGVEANNRVLKESGIHYLNLLHSIESFKENFGLLVEQMESRAELSKFILGQAGYIEHALDRRIDWLYMVVNRNMAGEKEIPAAIASIEQKEQREVAASQKKIISHALGVRSRFKIDQKGWEKAKKAMASLLLIATTVSVSTSGKPAGPDFNPETYSTMGAYGLMGQKKVGDYLQTQVIKTMPADAVDLNIDSGNIVVKNFPWDVSSKMLDKADNIDIFFANLVKSLNEAAHKEGYSNYKQFMKDRQIKLVIEDITGYASPEGTDVHNLPLSKKRAEKIRSYIVMKAQRAGVPVEFNPNSVKAGGEAGYLEVLNVVNNILKISNQSIFNFQEKAEISSLLPKARGGDKQSAERIFYLVHHNKKGADSILAPHRKGVIKMGLNYKHETTKKIPLISTIEIKHPVFGLMILPFLRGILPKEQDFLPEEKVRTPGEGSTGSEGIDDTGTGTTNIDISHPPPTSFSRGASAQRKWNKEYEKRQFAQMKRIKGPRGESRRPRGKSKGPWTVKRGK